MLIIHGDLITWEKPNRILKDHALYIDDGKIIEIGKTKALETKYPNETKLDAGRQYVMPGNICAHTHFYGAFSRGMAIPGSPPDAFPAILEKLWWPLDRSLTTEDVTYSTLVCLIDAIKHGTTTLIDHHASPNCIEESLDHIADVVTSSGLRASLCYEVTDRNGIDGARSGIKENDRFIRRIKNEDKNRGKLSAMFGLHASCTVSQETLALCRDACDPEIGFHIHVAEHPIDEYTSIEKFSMRVVDRLSKFEILGPKTIVVHAVHIDPREMELIARSHSWITHQPRSNMNNAVGLPDVEGMLRMGIKVGLGNDGFSNAMWEEWKAAYLAHKLINRDPRRMTGNTVVDMAIYHNAELAALQLGSRPLGVLAPGAEADIIFVDYEPITPLTPENLPWHILFGFREGMVTTTMVAGKILMHNREITTLDEEKISNHARVLSKTVWKRYLHNVKAGNRLWKM